MKKIQPIPLSAQCAHCNRKIEFSINKKPGFLRPVSVAFHCACGVDWMIMVKIHREKADQAGRTRLDIQLRAQNVPKKKTRVNAFHDDIRKLRFAE